MARLLARLAAAWFGFVVASAAGSVAAAVALKRRLLPRGGHGDDDVELVAIFEPLDFTSTATALRRMTVTTMFAGGTIDLRLATLDPAGGRLTVRTIFGGFRLVVPGTWRVEHRVIGVFGGSGDARDRGWVDPDHTVLTIDGFALFGGLGVISQAADLSPARPPTLVADGPSQGGPAGGDAAGSDHAGHAGSNAGLVTDIEQVPPSPAATDRA